MSAVEGQGNKTGKLAAVLLAAGLSERLGYPKQLCSLQGRTLLERTIGCLQHPAIEQIFVVTGAAREACWSLAQKCPGPISELFNPDYEEGMGSSIAAAARHLDFDAALFLVCDQVHLTREHIDRLIEASHETGKREGSYALTASSYQGTVGIPALFPRSYFAQLEGLRDSQRGAKALLLDSPSLVTVDFELGEEDVDTPEAVQRLGLTVNYPPLKR